MSYNDVIDMQAHIEENLNNDGTWGGFAGLRAKPGKGKSTAAMRLVYTQYLYAVNDKGADRDVWFGQEYIAERADISHDAVGIQQRALVAAGYLEPIVRASRAKTTAATNAYRVVDVIAEAKALATLRAERSTTADDRAAFDAQVETIRAKYMAANPGRYCTDARVIATLTGAPEPKTYHTKAVNVARKRAASKAMNGYVGESHEAGGVVEVNAATPAQPAPVAVQAPLGNLAERAARREAEMLTRNAGLVAELVAARACDETSAHQIVVTIRGRVADLHRGELSEAELDAETAATIRARIVEMAA